MTTINDAKTSLVVANRTFANESVLDAFGHVGLRHPDDPERFFLTRSLTPVEVTEHDILGFDMTSEPVEPFSGMLYSERVMYGAMFRPRPDVNAVCHHHAPAMLPFCLTGYETACSDSTWCDYRQTGADLGSAYEFDANNHLVIHEDEAVSLANCLGKNSIV